MSRPEPLSKAAELLSDFCDWTRANPVPSINAIELQRFKARAKEQMAFDAAIAHTVLGAIGAIQFKEAEMREHHEASIRLSRNDDLHQNYATSLQRCGFLNDAARITTQCFRKQPENLGYLEKAIRMTWLSGNISESLNLCSELCKRTQVDYDSLSDIQCAKHALEARGVPEAILAEGIEVSHSLLFERKIFSPSIKVLTDDEPGDESILYILTINADKDVADSLQSELAERLFQRLGDRWRPEVTMFEYEPYDGD